VGEAAGRAVVGLPQRQRTGRTQLQQQIDTPAFTPQLQRRNTDLTGAGNPISSNGLGPAGEGTVAATALDQILQKDITTGDFANKNIPGITGDSLRGPALLDMSSQLRTLAAGQTGDAQIRLQQAADQISALVTQGTLPGGHQNMPLATADNYSKAKDILNNAVAPLRSGAPATLPADSLDKEKKALASVQTLRTAVDAKMTDVQKQLESYDGRLQQMAAIQKKADSEGRALTSDEVAQMTKLDPTAELTQLSNQTRGWLVQQIDALGKDPNVGPNHPVVKELRATLSTTTDPLAFLASLPNTKKDIDGLVDARASVLSKVGSK
jgi:hypothetical protein